MKKFNTVRFAALLSVVLMGAVYAYAATTAPDLQTAANFAVLAGSGITDTTPSVIVGDAGSSPTTSNGLTGAEVTGTNYTAASSVVDQAKIDLTGAYGTAAAATPAVDKSGVDLGTMTLAPGVYSFSSSAQLTGTVTLDAAGDPSAVWIFKIGSTLTTASASVVNIINSGQACNVFWQVGSSATLGTGTQFAGNILALTSITDNGGSTVNGRLLAQNGAVTLNNTHVTKQTCVALPPPPPAPAPSSGGSSWYVAPLISILKVPSPLSLPQGPGSVTYTYTVNNVGVQPMQFVHVEDNKCSPVKFVSGDINSNSILDLNETWTYRCTTSVDTTTTNTATATGFSGGFNAVDTASATVVVGSPLTPPLIHVVKTANKYTLPVGGGPVTYSYAVTNPGTVPLSGVSITDNKCTDITRIANHPGDINNNNLLDPGETFHFTCTTDITSTTVNTATAEGFANGFAAVDYAQATVVVGAPGLPNTGFGPDNNKTLWDIVGSAGVLAVLFLLYTIRRKQTV